MNDHLEDQLFRKYPRIFEDRNLSPPTTTMAQGFSCGDGWFNLIDSLCMQISQYEEAVESSKAYDYQPLTASQVKEKFGELRFYSKGGDGRTKELIRIAQEESVSICEICGQPGRLRKKNTPYLWQTLCTIHAEEKGFTDT